MTRWVVLSSSSLRGAGSASSCVFIHTPATHVPPEVLSLPHWEAGCRRYRSEWVERAQSSAQHVHTQQELPLFLLLPTLPPKSGPPNPPARRAAVTRASQSTSWEASVSRATTPLPEGSTSFRHSLPLSHRGHRESTLCVTRGRGGGCSGVLALEGPHMQTWVHIQPSRTPSESFAGLFHSTCLLAGKLRASSSLPCCRSGKRRCVGVSLAL